MNKSRPQTVWHLFLITLFGLPLISPLLRWTAVPCTHDGHLHYHRIAAMRHAWENGLPFTRWLPDLAFGYGYPFFIYREPVPLYAGLIPHLLGLPLPAAENLVYILAILAGGWFMYLWVRDIFGTRAGIVSAVAYMAAPYVLVDALIRGNSPESVALPLFPLLLWLGRRWLLMGTARYFLLAVFSLAMLALSHNISLLLFTPTLGIYLLAVGWVYRLDWRQVVGRLALLFGLGLGMTAFYSGGALLEMGQVTLQQSTTTRNNDFHYNFTTLGEIFSPVPTKDSSLINPPLPFRLGWMPSLLAILGLTSLFWKKKIAEAEPAYKETANSNHHQSFDFAQDKSSIINREQRWHIILMAVATAVFLLLSLPITLPIWENVPLIDFLQFPWRMVGRAALPVAFLAGVPFAGGKWQAAGRSSRIRDYGLRLTFFAALLLFIVEAIPMLYPTTCKEEPFPTINKVHNYEHISGLVGVDPEGSYFPKTVQHRPKESVLEADFQAGQTPKRFDDSAMPDDAAIISSDYGRLSATVQLSSPDSFTARYLTFDFPGWTAQVDGRSVPITPSDPDGLITFPVPAGDHSITVRWGSTPLRTTLLGFSIMAMAGVLVTAVIIVDHQLIVSSNQLSANRKPKSDQGKRKMEYGLLVTALALIAIKFLVVDRVDTPLRQAEGPSVSHPLVLQAAELRFEGYNLSQNSVESGKTFDIDMAWTAVSQPTADYQSNIWLVGPDGLIWSDKETQRPRLYETAPRTRNWLPSQWAWDSREIEVFSGTPPGQYDIVLTLFDKADLQPLTLLGEDATVVGPTAVIGQIEVTRPDEPAGFEPQFPIEAPIADLTLLGYNQDRNSAAPGDVVLLTLFWEKPVVQPSAFSVFQVQLFDEQGNMAQTWPILPARVDYSSHDWLPGERLRGQHLLRLPASLDSGDYQFVLNSTALGQITIQTLDRIFDQPEVETAVGTTFSDSKGNPLVKLIGYTAETCDLPIVMEPSVPCSLHLVWEAQTEITTSYRVFIHLVDENGQIIAQSDGEPANWSRPTTSWAINEFIVDSHTITLPDPLPDGLRIFRVGLYDPANGQRLFADLTDFIELP